MVKHRTFWNTYSLPVKCGDTVAGRRPRWAVSALAWLGPTELARTRALKPDDMPRKMWSIRTSIAVLIRPNGCGRCPRRWRRVRRTRRKTRIRWRSSAREVAQKGFVYGSPFPHRYPGGHDPNGARVAFDLSPPTTSAWLSDTLSSPSRRRLAARRAARRPGGSLPWSETDSRIAASPRSSASIVSGSRTSQSLEPPADTSGRRNAEARGAY